MADAMRTSRRLGRTINRRSAAALSAYRKMGIRSAVVRYDVARAILLGVVQVESPVKVEPSMQARTVACSQTYFLSWPKQTIKVQPLVSFQGCRNVTR